MQDHLTERLSDALHAGFNSCAEHGRPLTAEQQADLLASAFSSFADEIFEELRREVDIHG